MRLLVGSTGLRLRGAGGWLHEEHDTKLRRPWRKLLFAGTGSAYLFAPVTGSGTLTVDGGSLFLSNVSDTQIVNFLGGGITGSGFNSMQRSRIGTAPARSS